MSIATWWFSARWLVFPAVAFISTVYFLIARRAGETRLARLLAEHYIVMVVILVVFDAAGGALLRFFYYASYLIPAMALAVGVQMRAALTRLRPAQYVAMLGVVFAAFALTLLPSVESRLFPAGWYGSPRMFVGPVVALLAALVLLRVSANRLTLATFLICAGVVNVLTKDGTTFSVNGSWRADTFLATAAASRVLMVEDPRVSALVWFNQNTPLGLVHISIAGTHMFGYRLVGTRFPSLWNPFTQADARLEAGQDLVILTGEEGAFAEAEAAVRPRGLGLTLVSRRDVTEGHIRLTLLFVRTGVDRRTLADARLPASDVFFDGGRKLNAASVAVDAAEGLLHITTNRSMYDFQFVSRPIPVTPNRRLLAEFDLRIPTGGAGFHVIASKTRAVLASRLWCGPPVPTTHVQLTFDPGPNDSVEFVLSNCGSSYPIVSDFTVKDIQLWPYR